MQSSFKVIKEPSVISQGSKAIVTEYIPIQYYEAVQKLESQQEDGDAMEHIQPSMKQYEEMAATLLENGRRQSEAIVQEAMVKAELIQKEAYEMAYNKGYEEGQQKGYSDAYEQNLPNAQQEAELLIENAERVLQEAKDEYEVYLSEKKEEIFGLAINIAKHI